jgi:hypothetical protein
MGWDGRGWLPASFDIKPQLLLTSSLGAKGAATHPGSHFNHRACASTTEVATHHSEGRDPRRHGAGAAERGRREAVRGAWGACSSQATPPHSSTGLHPASAAEK